MMINKTALLATTLTIGLAIPAYAAGGHEQGTESHTTEASKAHGDSHGNNEKPHFAVNKPETVETAWAMIDETIVSARQALKDNNIDVLHEAGEKLAAAVAALHDHPQAVKEVNGEKLTSALDQLTKTVDRFHHAAEDKDMVGATEALDLLENQKSLVQSLYDLPKE